MRFPLRTCSILAALSVIGGCPPVTSPLPGGSNSNRTSSPATNQLGITLSTPATDQTVAADSSVSIVWSAANATGESALVTIRVERVSDQTETTVAAGLEVLGPTGDRTTVWRTRTFEPGEYRVRATITTSTESRSAVAEGRITLDAIGTFAFTRPTADLTLPENDPVEITWTGFDPDGGAMVMLFVDPDDLSSESNRIAIAEVALNDSEDDDEQTFDWSGTDIDGANVDPATYSVIAVVTGGENPDQTFVANAQITVPEREDMNTAELGFASPEEDTTFLTTDDPLALTLNVNRASEQLLDIAIDTDDNHANGNEQTILSQRFIEAETDTTDFDWDGTDSDGNAVDDGIYRLFFVSSTGTGTPTVDDAEFLVFRRSDENQPLIGVTAPSGVLTVNPGQFLNINWRDDVPDEDAGATIRITIDDDNQPAEAVETDEAEIEILADRDAVPDGVQDTFAYRIPASLTPGTYFIFAYIDATSATPDADHVSVGPVAFRVEDPANPSN